MTTFLFALLLAGVSLSCGFGAVCPAPPIDALLSFETASNPQISPDGSLIVYQSWHTNWDTNSFVSDLWVVKTAAPFHRYPLASGQTWNGEAQWSADGRYVGFLSDRSGRREVWITPAAAGEAKRMTDTPRGVNAFRWSPDGKTIAFTTEGDDQAEGARSDKYGVYEVVKTEPISVGLWAAHVPSDLTKLTAVPDEEELVSDSEFSVGGFAYSPDGQQIAFHAERPGSKTPGRREQSGLYSLSVSSFEVRKLISGSGPYRNPVWSPDGKWVAFEKSSSANYFYANWSVARVSATGGGEPEVLTGSFDENADLIAWTAQGVWFGALQRTASHLFLLNLDTRVIKRMSGPDSAEIGQFSVSETGSWAGIQGSSTSLPEVVLGDRKLTTFGEQLQSYSIARREVIRWKSTDGMEVEGVLLKPVDFDPSKKYPLLVILHGGPVVVEQPVMRPDRTYPVEQFVARGALVLRPNYRGSAGYGEAVRGANVRNLGTGDAADVLGGVDALIARGFVDADRVGAMGWSQGGFISAYLGMATDRFRAVSVGAGITDWTTYYVNTDITAFTRQYMKATPWDDPDIYRKASPIAYLSNAKTPVLIQHGDQDRRVPIPNAYELRQALEDRGVPVKMVVYRGFGHTVDRPKQQRALMEQNLDWFTEWVLAPVRKFDGHPVNLSRSETTDATATSLNSNKKN